MNNRDYYFIKPYDDNLAKPPAESFGQILNETYLHPFDWKARTTRKSFWISVLINAILSILAMILMGYAFGSDISLGLKWIDGVIAGVVCLWIFLAGLGQTVRRLHDVGYSGYWYWASFTGYGAMFIFYLELQPSVQRKVKWGKYLFSKQEYYEEQIEKVPVPTIGQILKEHFFDCFKWNARSTRTSYWVGTAVKLFLRLYYIAYFFIVLAAFKPIADSLDKMPTFMIIFLCICTLVLVVLFIWALIAQIGHAVRRLHDAGFSGWLWWISLVPYIGRILLTFLLFHPTVNKEVKWNKYLFQEDDRIR